MTSVMPGQSSTYRVQAARQSNATDATVTTQSPTKAAMAHRGSTENIAAVVKAAASIAIVRSAQWGGLQEPVESWS